MTDSAPPKEGPAGPADPSSAPSAAARRRWPRWVALGTTALVLVAAGAGAAAYRKLEGNIRTDADTAAELRRHEDERPEPEPEAGEAENILLLGSDSRAGGNGAYGRDEGTQRSDTAILLHLSADRSHATAVSLPRDLMVPVPRCDGTSGSSASPDAGADPGTNSGTDSGAGTGTNPGAGADSRAGAGAATGGAGSGARLTQFNWAFQQGGAACTIRTVENLTGIRVDHHVIVDFQGFKELVDAVDGVEVCLAAPVSDREARLTLPAGRQTLDGEEALGYVRARHGIGDGSDTERIGRQQQFLGSLVKKMRSNGVLLNPGKLFPVLDSATSALTADPGLDSLGELYELARGLGDIPADNVAFLTVPRRPYTFDRNRDELVQPEADQLFAQLRADRPVHVGKEDTGDGAQERGTPHMRATRDHGHDGAMGTASDSGPGGPGDAGTEGSRTVDRNGTSGGPDGMAPVYRGTTAAQDICGGAPPENGVN